MKNLNLLAFILISLSMAQACTKARIIVAPESVAPASTELSYANLNTQIFAARCLNCHSDSGGNKGDVNLESFENVQIHLDEVIEEIESGSMPPSGALPSDLIALATAWKKIGAPLEAPTKAISLSPR